LAEVSCLKCASCGYWICLDYRIELVGRQSSTDG